MIDSDTEHLRFAAKAAGYKFGVIYGITRIYVEEGWTPWNPLGDNGCAMQLLNDCLLSITHDELIPVGHLKGFGLEYERGVEVWRVNPNTGFFHKVSLVYGNHRDLNTRRAIVRVAAEVGGLVS